MIEQFAIALFGVTAIWLSQSEHEGRRKWASVFGLIGQPFWFYAAWVTGQWGIFFLSFLYTAAWFKGFRTHWLRRFLCGRCGGRYVWWADDAGTRFCPHCD